MSNASRPIKWGDVAENEDEDTTLIYRRDLSSLLLTTYRPPTKDQNGSITGPQPNYEIEVRLGYYQNYIRNGMTVTEFISNVRYQDYNRLATALKSHKYTPVTYNMTTESYDLQGYIDHDVSMRRRMIEGQNYTYEKKDKYKPINVTDLKLRIAVSREIPQNKSDFRPPRPSSVYTSKVTRSEYAIPQYNLRVDMTRSHNAQGSFEVEIEYVSPSGNNSNIPNDDNLDRYLTGVDWILREMYSTRKLYGMTKFENMNKIVNDALGSGLSQYDRIRYIDRATMSEARNLKDDDLRLGAMVGGPWKYNVSHKVDGQRRMLIFCPSGCWMVYPPYEANWLGGSYEGITIIDGELVTERKPGSPIDEYWYIILDGLMMEGEDLRTQSFEYRHRTVRTYLRRSGADYIDINDSFEEIISGGTVTTEVPPNPGDPVARLPRGLRIDVKKYKAINTVDDFYRSTIELRDEIGMLKYPEDGLIFTPVNGGKDCGYVLAPTSGIRGKARSLKTYPDICKWKPPTKLTIDFLVRKDATGQTQLYMMGYNEGQELAFTTKPGSMFPYDPNTMLDRQNVPDNIPDNVVVEYGWNGSQLYHVKLRSEKKSPNAIDVVNNVWYQMHRSLTENEIKGLGLETMFRYHNRIKASLLARAAVGGVGPVLLDIGSGRGGDISKWKAYSKIIAVEPEVENRDELKSRLESYPNMTGRVTVVDAYGQDTDKIRSKVNEITQGRGVDVISIMNVMTFFWQDMNILKALVNTIKTCLKSGGKLIWMVMDGDVVRQVMSPVLGGVTFYSVESNGFKLEPDEDWKTSRGVTVTFPPSTIVGEKQHEWLVRTTDLSQMLECKEIFKHRADNEFMSPGCSLVSGLYSYGMWEVKNVTPNMTGQTKTPSEIDMSNLFTPLASAATLAPRPIPENVSINPFPPVQSFSEMSMKQYEQPEIALESLVPSMSTVPVIERLPTPRHITDAGYEMVRLATIGDGTCFVHGVLQAVNEKYRASTYNEKSQMARTFRSELAEWLRRSDPEAPTGDGLNNYIQWETVNKSAYIEYYFMQLASVLDQYKEWKTQNPNSTAVPAFREWQNLIGEDYSLPGLYNLYNSSKCLGDEVFQLVADVLNVTIYTITSSTVKIAASARSNNPKRASIVLLNLTRKSELQKSKRDADVKSHYETVGMRNIRTGVVYTMFPPDEIAQDRDYPKLSLVTGIDKIWEVEDDQGPKMSKSETVKDMYVKSLRNLMMTYHDYATFLYDVLDNTQRGLNNINEANPVFNFIWASNTGLGNGLLLGLPDTIKITDPVTYYVGDTIKVLSNYIQNKTIQLDDEQYKKGLASNTLWIALMVAGKVIREYYLIDSKRYDEDVIRREILTAYDKDGKLGVATVISNLTKDLEKATGRTSPEWLKYADQVKSYIAVLQKPGLTDQQRKVIKDVKDYQQGLQKYVDAMVRRKIKTTV